MPQLDQFVVHFEVRVGNVRWWSFPLTRKAGNTLQKALLGNGLEQIVDSLQFITGHGVLGKSSRKEQGGAWG